MVWSPPSSTWSPPSGSSCPTPLMPEVLLDLDFTSLVNQDLTASGDGNYTLSNGQVVSIVGTAQVDSMDIVNGTGLKIVITGAAGAYKGGTLGIDMSTFASLEPYDMYRVFGEYAPVSMTGHANGPAVAWLIRGNPVVYTDGVLMRLAKYLADATYTNNMAINGLTLTSGLYSGGPAGAWGDLGTTTVPAVSRLSIHGTDGDTWYRGDTGTSGLPPVGTLPLRARVRLQGKRFQTTDDYILSNTGVTQVGAATYDAVDMVCTRLVIERYGAP